MSETVFKSILEESARLEWDKYGSVPEHTFSAKHCRAMKRIFKAYERQTAFLSDDTICKGSAVSHFRWNRRTVAAMVILIFMAVLAGCSAIIYLIGGFKAHEYSDNTQLFPIDLGNCPQSIEEVYYLPEIPGDFELLEESISDISVYTAYINSTTRQTIAFSQSVKTAFAPHYNTEYFSLEEISIGGNKGIGLEGKKSYIVAWDNGDYILEISADLPKSEVLNLAKSAKVLEN